jgi:hypothetical protein
MAMRIVLWLLAGLAGLFGLFLFTYSGGGSGVTDAGMRVMWICLVAAPVLAVTRWWVARPRRA